MLQDELHGNRKPEQGSDLDWHAEQGERAMSSLGKFQTDH